MAPLQTPDQQRSDTIHRLSFKSGRERNEVQLVHPTTNGAVREEGSDTSEWSLASRREQAVVQVASDDAWPANFVPSQRGCSWDDVLGSIEETRVEYERKAGKNRLRAIPRSPVIVTTLHGLTEMIPEQDGLSILRGGLKLIFGVRKPANETRTSS